jgi:hypothetical protein
MKMDQPLELNLGKFYPPSTIQNASGRDGIPLKKIFQSNLQVHGTVVVEGTSEPRLQKCVCIDLELLFSNPRW